MEEVRIAVKSGLGIQSIQDLNGKTVAATADTTSVQILREHERATGVDFKEVFGKDHTDSFLMLEVGRADAFVMDASILAASIAKSKHPAHFKVLDEVLSVEPIACMLRKDDPAFKRRWTTACVDRWPTVHWPGCTTSGSCNPLRRITST